MQQLSASWRDQEHAKFSAEFEQELKQLAKLIEAAERHVPYLIRKAELIEEYQRGHG
jgi:endonuclease III